MLMSIYSHLNFHLEYGRKQCKNHLKIASNDVSYKLNVFKIKVFGDFIYVHNRVARTVPTI